MHQASPTYFFTSMRYFIFIEKNTSHPHLNVNQNNLRRTKYRLLMGAYGKSQSILSYYSDIINITHHTRGTLASIEGCTIFTDSCSSHFYHRAQYILYLFPSISAI